MTEFKLAPVEPTPEMIDAGLAQYDGSDAPEDELARAYRAMIAVADTAWEYYHLEGVGMVRRRKTSPMP